MRGGIPYLSELRLVGGRLRGESEISSLGVEKIHGVVMKYQKCSFQMGPNL